MSDKKIGVSSNGTTIDYYNADVITATDYAPFGSILAGRNYNAPGAKDARYGFNGKENDNEVKGEGNQQDYGMRIYDPRLGKFLSVDPLARHFAWNSTYAYAENDVIRNIDLDGAEKMPYGHPANLPMLGKSKSYNTSQGNSAQNFKVEEYGGTYNITKITVYEQCKDAFGRVHHFNNYYFVQDKALVSETDKSSASGTTFKTKGTNWHYYLSDNNGMSRQFNQTVAVADGIGIGAFAFAATISGGYAVQGLGGIIAPALPAIGRFLFSKNSKQAALIGGGADFTSQTIDNTANFINSDDKTRGSYIPYMWNRWNKLATAGNAIFKNPLTTSVISTLGSGDIKTLPGNFVGDAIGNIPLPKALVGTGFGTGMEINLNMAGNTLGNIINTQTAPDKEKK